MNAAVRRANVAGAPYFSETEVVREQERLERREKFFAIARQAILFTLATAAVVMLRVSLGF